MTGSDREVQLVGGPFDGEVKPCEGHWVESVLMLGEDALEKVGEFEDGTGVYVTRGVVKASAYRRTGRRDGSGRPVFDFRGFETYLGTFVRGSRMT